jgi:hypothetical protein
VYESTFAPAGIVHVTRTPSPVYAALTDVGAGTGSSTLMVTAAHGPVQALTSATEYVVVVEGVTVYVAVPFTTFCTCPSDHRIVHGPPPETVAVSVVVSPARIDVREAVTVTSGRTTSMIRQSELVRPQFVTVTSSVMG